MAIQVLNDSLINQIAAGEVVERPASIVKELVENSIDAKSNEVKILIEEGGLKKIVIIDNGSGITKEDLPLVFTNHATSKIRSIEDLDHIMSLGFRGEAMASISSIAHVTLTSKTENDIAYQWKNSEISTATHNKGTTIVVEELFYNVPARKKFLKTPSTEFKYILDVITKIALANPEISFELINNDKKVLKLDKNQSLEERIKNLLKLESTIHVMYDGRIKIDGYVVDSKFVNPRPINQFVIVNGRTIISNFVNKAVTQGYGTSIMRGQYPSFVINILMDPADLDVNIHPRKTEVRFKNESEIFQSAYYAVKDAVEKFQRKFISEIGKGFNSENYEAKNILNEVDQSNVNNETPFGQSYAGNDFGIQKPKFDFQAAMDFSKEVIKNDEHLVQSNMLPENTMEQAREVLPQCMQVNNSYIVTYNAVGLQIIDQHAASERFLFEKFLMQVREENIEKQILALPIHLNLSVSENNLLKDNKETFNELGFDVEEFGDREFQIRALPMNIPNTLIESLIREILSDIQNFDKHSGLESAYKKIAASLACHAAVRFGDKLSEMEMQKVITDLKTCENPYTCPHGRPTLHNIPKYELDKIFKRIQPQNFG